MSVTVKLHSLLQHKFADGQDTFDVAAATPLDCLCEMESRFPKMKKWLYDAQGELRPQVWFFVNGEKLNPDERASPLTDGDEVMILLAVAGG
jgi:molybdopterin converting factor small subunit